MSFAGLFSSAEPAHSAFSDVESNARVEAMFQQIMHAVHKSVSYPSAFLYVNRQSSYSIQHHDISELRQECAELRMANVALERQVREGLQVCQHMSLALLFAE